MIGRLLTQIVDRIAEKLMDRDWLHEMRFREQVAREATRDGDPRNSERPPASDQWPARERRVR